MNENDDPSRTRGTSTVPHLLPRALPAIWPAGPLASAPVRDKDGGPAAGSVACPPAPVAASPWSLSVDIISSPSIGAAAVARAPGRHPLSPTPPPYTATRFVASRVAWPSRRRRTPALQFIAPTCMHASPSSSWRMDANTTHLSHSQPLLLYCTAACPYGPTSWTATRDGQRSGVRVIARVA
jgi:hypothetical protein